MVVVVLQGIDQLVDALPVLGDGRQNGYFQPPVESCPASSNIVFSSRIVLLASGRSALLTT